MDGDDAMRAHYADLPVPEFAEPAFTTPLPLRQATIAVVTTAALHRPDDAPFARGDTTFRTLDRFDRELRLGRWSLNFDRSGFAVDVNVVYPIERLEEMAADGEIGAVAPHHLSFAGVQPDTVAPVRLDSGPAAARRLRDDDVDVVLLTPVSPLCSRTVCALAHVLEAAGLATVGFVAIRSIAERMRPPRALYGEFPLGRPLGKPGDPDFQRDVLRRAFDLLGAPSGPLLVDHPAVIVAEKTPLVCALPPRYDPRLPAAVDEAAGLRAAYERSRTHVGGRRCDEWWIATAFRMRWASWTPLPLVLPGTRQTSPARTRQRPCMTSACTHEKAALELVDGPPPGARQAETWFYETTEAGRTVRAAQHAMQSAGAPLAVSFYMAPGHR